MRALDSKLVARGALELLWDSCYESGEDYVGTSDDIETLVGWTGERGVLTRALVEAGAPEGDGFIESVDGGHGFRVHDLWHHAPEYVAKRRKRELERQQKMEPEVVRRTAPNGGQCPPTPDWQNGVGRTPSPSPSHSPSPGEKNVCAEASSAPEPRTPVEVCELTFLSFPVIGPGGNVWALSETQVVEWARLFLGLDVRGESRKALAWLQANAGRRKTGKGMKRFLVSWLSRASDRRPGASATERVASMPMRVPWECPHEPRCEGQWRCVQRTDLEQMRAS